MRTAVRIAPNLNYFLSPQENIFLNPSVALPLKDFLIREYSSVSISGFQSHSGGLFYRDESNKAENR